MCQGKYMRSGSQRLGFKFAFFLCHLSVWDWSKSHKHWAILPLSEGNNLFYHWVVGLVVGRGLQGATRDFIVLLSSTLGLKWRRYSTKSLLNECLMLPLTHPGGAVLDTRWPCFPGHSFFRTSRIPLRSGAGCLLTWESSMSYEERWCGKATNWSI